MPHLLKPGQAAVLSLRAYMPNRTGERFVRRRRNVKDKPEARKDKTKKFKILKKMEILNLTRS